MWSGGRQRADVFIGAATFTFFLLPFTLHVPMTRLTKTMRHVALLLTCVVAASAFAAELAGSVPYVTGDGNGGFAVSYVAGDSLRFVTISGEKTSAPREIAKGNLLVNRADFPSIAVAGKAMVAQWSTRNGHGAMVHVARSTDGGATWTKPATPHPAKVSEFGFVSLSPQGDALWLDGRNLKGGEEGEGDMELHFATLPFAKDEALDHRVCDCCQTSLAMTSSGPIVAYRDRSPEEIRDIAVMRKTANGWTAPKIVHADGWKMTGCPVNGPQLDARDARVAIAWFTAANQHPRVYAAFSNDAGATFSAPLQLDLGKPAGRVDLALLASGDAAVTWVEQRGEKTMLFARRIGSTGTLGKPLEVGEARGFPRLAISKENVGIAWAAGERVHFRTINLP
jgi:hypothetical protein